MSPSSPGVARETILTVSPTREHASSPASYDAYYNNFMSPEITYDWIITLPPEQFIVFCQPTLWSYHDYLSYHYVMATQRHFGFHITLHHGKKNPAKKRHYVTACWGYQACKIVLSNTLGISREHNSSHPHQLHFILAQRLRILSHIAVS